MKEPPIDIDYIRLRCDCSEDGCWEWSGAKRQGRWPTVGLRRPDENGVIKAYHFYVRHIVYWIKHGMRPPLGEKRTLGTTCGNALCVSPEHIKILSRKHVNKGVPKPALHGQKVAAARRKQSKLSDEDVAAIRESDISAQEASILYGVTDKYIYQIRRGEWRKDYSSPFAGLGARP